MEGLIDMKMSEKNNKNKIILPVVLHTMIFIFSLGSVFSKMASGEDFLSTKFILCYGAVFLALGIYALGWQQIIKRIPLTTAYANKAVTIVWGMILGAVIFGEKITVKQVIGAVIVMAGVILFAFSDNQEKSDVPSSDEYENLADIEENGGVGE